MGYTTASVSRRVVVVKVKGKAPPGTGSRKPAAQDPSASHSLPSAKPVKPAVERADVVPLLFERNRALARAPAKRSDAWKSWLAASFFVALSGALFFAIHATLVNPAGRADAQSPRAPKRAKADGEIIPQNAQNPHAMRTTASHRAGASPPSGGPVAGAAHAGAVRGSANRDAASDTEAARPGLVDAADPAFFDGRKLILPENVSGNCDIGERGARDFGVCLVQNGARSP